MDIEPINTYVINLKSRTDRKRHSINQFENRNEFNFNIVDAIESEQGSIGLWETIISVLKNSVSLQDDFIIICEDDHEFTGDYNKTILFNAIMEAKRRNIDVLLGGVSWFNYALQIGKREFLVDQFNGLQFTVIFKQFYNTILETEFTKDDSADFKISSLTDKIVVMYPFISVQKEFGYSDVTHKNGVAGHVTNLFRSRSEKLRQLVMVANFYDFKFD